MGYKKVIESNILFYGKDYTPLSRECSGCPFFGELCLGSVYEGGECRAGVIKDIRPSLVAYMVLEATDNRFTLARTFGVPIDEMVQGRTLSEDLDKEYQEAIQTPQDVIDRYKKLFLVNVLQPVNIIS